MKHLKAEKKSENNPPSRLTKAECVEAITKIYKTSQGTSEERGGEH